MFELCDRDEQLAIVPDATWYNALTATAWYVQQDRPRKPLAVAMIVPSFNPYVADTRHNLSLLRVVADAATGGRHQVDLFAANRRDFLPLLTCSHDAILIHPLVNGVCPEIAARLRGGKVILVGGRGDTAWARQLVSTRPNHCTPHVPLELILAGAPE